MGIPQFDSLKVALSRARNEKKDILLQFIILSSPLFAILYLHINLTAEINIIYMSAITFLLLYSDLFTSAYFYDNQPSIPQSYGVAWRLTASIILSISIGVVVVSLLGVFVFLASTAFPVGGPLTAISAVVYVATFLLCTILLFVYIITISVILYMYSNESDISIKSVVNTVLENWMSISVFSFVEIAIANALFSGAAMGVYVFQLYFPLTSFLPLLLLSTTSAIVSIFIGRYHTEYYNQILENS